MNFREIKAMVKTGENDILEFKQKASFPEKIVKEIVAFANTRGGDLLLGVGDDGTIPGLKYAEEEAYALETAIERYCFPRIRYKSETVSISDRKAVLCYKIYESRKKPHFVLPTNIDGRKKAYIRINDKSVQASPEIIQILKKGRSRKGVKFHFGEKERILLQFLDSHESITMEEYSGLAGISRDDASKTLISLVLANVLTIEPGEDKDRFKQRVSHES